jgi:hypothetical protein
VRTREQPFADNSVNNTSNPGTRRTFSAINLPLQLSVTTAELWDVAGNKPGFGIVVGGSGKRRFEKPT